MHPPSTHPDSAPPPIDLPALQRKTQFNLRLAFRVRLHERDAAVIERWLLEAREVEAFLTHFYLLPPAIRDAMFRKPQPTTHHTPPSPPPPPPPPPIEPPPPSHLRDHLSLLPFLFLSASPGLSDAAPSSADALPPFSVGLSSYSSPWLEWLRSTRPVSLTLHLLDSLHTATHTPWWLTLILAGLITRTALLPLVVYQAHLLHSISRLQPSFAYIRRMVAASTLPPLRKAWEAGRMRWALYWKYSCHPLKLLVPGLCQLSALLLVAVSLRPLLLLSPDLQVGGGGWVTDLSAYDPYYILPIAVTALQYTFLYYTEHLARRNSTSPTSSTPSPSTSPASPPLPPPTSLSSLTSSSPHSLPSRLASLFSYYRGYLIILLLPLISTLPSGLFVFQLTTLTYQLVQAGVMAQPAVRRWLGLDTGARQVWKRREEATEEEVREFERLKGEIERRMQVKAGVGGRVEDGRGGRGMQASVAAPVQMFVKPQGKRGGKAGKAGKAAAMA